MRILQVSNGYPHRAYGGVELHTYRVVGALRQRGHDVSVFTRLSDLAQVDGSIVDEEVDGTPVRSVVNDFKAGAFRDHYLSAGVAERFGEYLKEVDPEIVHFQHLIGLSADLPAIARAHGARVVASVLDYWYVCQRVMFQHRDGTRCGGPAHQSCVDCVLGGSAPARGWFERTRDRLRTTSADVAAMGPESNRHRFRALRDALATFERMDTCADFVVEEFARQGMPFPINRTRVIALSVDREGFPPPTPPADLPVREERPLRVGFVGHSLHHKGPHVLLEALRLLPGRPIEVQFWGKRWPDHSYDAGFSGLLENEPRAAHRGRFADGELSRVLGDVDVLCVPSTCLETYGLATREAFVAGRPVVTSDRGALPESVRDGVDGLIFPGEDPSALAAALARLIDEPALLPALAAGATEASQRVKSMDQYAAEIEEFLYR
ncbi:MAG: glycosyltransferase [Candidatus Binatia bacterium]|nr:glycosyltransferase [Candidatus Binatia bacterium]